MLGVTVGIGGSVVFTASLHLPLALAYAVSFRSAPSSALAAAGTFSVADAARLLRLRGEAMQRLRAGAIAPDIVLADYHLDGDTGVAVVRALREQLGHDLAAVIITADRSPEVQELVRGAGLHILRKPLRPAALRAVMAQSRLRHAAAAE